MFGFSPETIFQFHASLLMDRARTGTFERAIASLVKPGDVVLDLGSGTGILSFFACRAGARRVYAVESGEVAELSKLLTAANGLQDRVVFLNDSSYDVDLPEKVDVVVTDTFDTFGLQDGLLGSIIDARRRFLREDGTIIPRSMDLFVVPVELPDVYRGLDIWNADLYGFDFSPALDFATSNLYSVPVDTRVFREAFLGEPRSLLRIRLSDAETPNVSGDVVLVANRSDVMHGLGGWFAAELGEGIILSNSPEIVRVSWKYAFLPLNGPIQVEQGERLNVSVQCCDGAAWRWRVECAGRSPAERASLRGFPFSKERFHKLSPVYAPKLTLDGEAELFLLGLFGGERTVGEMEEDLLRRYPERFRSPEAAARFVRDVAGRCS